MQEIPSAIGLLKELVTLIISGCKELKSLPNEIGNLSKNLRCLKVQFSGITSLPASIGSLRGLLIFNIEGCYDLLGVPIEIIVFIQCIMGIRDRVKDYECRIYSENDAKLMLIRDKTPWSEINSQLIFNELITTFLLAYMRLRNKTDEFVCISFIDLSFLLSTCVKGDMTGCIFPSGKIHQ